MPDLDLPPVIGHRGAAAHAPENTLAGFRAARALGCSWVEFDVRLTADDVLVVCHDDRLERTTDGRGRISRLPLAAVRGSDAGRRFGASFAGELVPTLAEALGLCRELGLGANIEIKAERGRGPATVAALTAYLGDMTATAPTLLISSFLKAAVAEAAARLPRVKRGVLFGKIPREWAAIAAELSCTTVHAGEASLHPEIAGEIAAAGYPLLAYTVNDPQRARQLLSWGVASVFTDAPDIILAAVAKGAATARGTVC